MASDSSPGGTYRKGYEKVGPVAPYLLTTAVAPAYGTADSNGYIGVSQDYNKHANAVDRPNAASVQLAADELEDPDVDHQLGVHDGPKPVFEDDYTLGDGERDADAKANREAVTKLEEEQQERAAAEQEKAEKTHAATKKAPAKAGGKSLAEQKASSDKQE